ncbi:MAG: BACON domain-containing protein, partial [Acidimicrobiia bacterium]
IIPASPASGTRPTGLTSTTTSPAATAPSTTPAPPGPPGLVIDTPALDLGTTGTTGQVRFTNSGGQALAWTVSSPLAAVTASPASGVLAPGAQASVTVTLDRATAPEGPLAVDLAVGGQGTVTGAAAGPRPVPVRAEVDHAPVVTGVSTDRPRIVFASSTCATTRATAAVSDESAVTVVLSWRQAVGSTTEVTMGALGGGRYGGTIGPVPTPSGGNVTWWVTATDAPGNRTRSADQTLPVTTTC